jgi:hypothetical protein
LVPIAVAFIFKDTTDYLKKMENLTIPENTTLVTMDVTSLYTNIPHDDRIAACRKIWEQRTDQEPPAWLNGILLKQCLGW